MRFTYNAYIGLIKRLRSKDYKLVGYSDYKNQNKCVILRHDVDTSIDKALELATLENRENVRSTYFFLLNTDFYNIGSYNSMKKIQQIHDMGHEIGLHFDETKYANANDVDLVSFIMEEANIMKLLLKVPIHSVSMHRPTQTTLDSDLKIDGLINSYGFEFFKQFKYVSDSRRRWRESIEELIDSNQYKRIHILTHPFWYNKEEIGLKDTIRNFIDDAVQDRYDVLEQNITDLNSIITKSEFDNHMGDSDKKL